MTTHVNSLFAHLYDPEIQDGGTVNKAIYKNIQDNDIALLILFSILWRA